VTADKFDPRRIVEVLNRHRVEYVLVGGHTIGSITVKVAGLEDVIKSKSAAARPKDLDALPELLRIARNRAGD
jgi:hypothetical protein